MIQPQLVLADAVGQAITVAFVVISLIGWIINLVNAQAKPAAPNRGNKPARPRSERVQSEIEQFMRDQAERRKGAEQQPQARPPEPKRPAPRRTAPQPARAQRQPQRVAPAPEPKPARPGESIAERKSIGSRDLGKGLREHVRTTMQERVQSGASQHLTHSIDQSVSQHLGTFSGQASKAEAAPHETRILAAGDILALLRTREGMRQAFILNEILQRPKLGKRSR
jgi:hypothetical protein